jgi:hypothetical protein
MEKIDSRLKEISDELNKHIIAVKGALELAEESASMGELHDLLVKAIARMDSIQRLSIEILAVLKQVFERMEEMKKTKPGAEDSASS